MVTLHKSIRALFQKGSPHIKEFNKHIRLMGEMGLIKKWMENSLGNANKCSTMAKMLQTHERQEVALNLHVTSTFFYLVLVGLVTTGLIFGVEIFIKVSMLKNNAAEHPNEIEQENQPAQLASQPKIKIGNYTISAAIPV